MTDEVWVVNASPLILLGKLGRTDLLEKLARQVIVPQAVFREVAAGATGDAAMQVALGWAAPRVQNDILVPPPISAWDLGAGESQVLAHCLVGGHRAVLDDGEARAAAKVHSVLLVGSLGVILRARKAGLIPAARPLIEELIESGSYLSADLVRQALLKVGE
jgi:predicted nucleic acid-binding protein